MEGEKNIVEENRSNVYLNRLMHYSGYGAIIGGLASMLLLMKFRNGFIFGLGLGAGYCHSDLKLVYRDQLSANPLSIFKKH